MRMLNGAVCLIFVGLLIGCERSPDAGAMGEDEITASARERDTNAPSSTEADNTGRNVRDRDESALTPGDQGANEADREVTRRIRKAITSHDQLSTDASNIKIITINGKVTLRGPVNSTQERDIINSIVQQAGVTSVDNQLEVVREENQEQERK